MLSRLDQFETLYEAMHGELDALNRDLEKMRAAGRTRTVTYRQMLANRVVLTTLIGRFTFYGL